MSESATTTIESTPKGPSILAGCAILGTAIAVPVCLLMREFARMTAESIPCMEEGGSELLSSNNVGILSNRQSVCDRLSAKFHALSRIPALESQVKKNSHGIYQQVSAALRTRHRDSQSTERLESQLDAAIGSADRRLKNRWTSILAENIQSSLAAMGYRTLGDPRAVEGNRSLLRAELPGTRKAAVFEMNPDSGQLSFDLSGFDGVECSKTRKRLVEELAARGIRLKVEEYDYHRRSEGSHLTKKAIAETQTDSVQEQNRRLLAAEELQL